MCELWGSQDPFCTLTPYVAGGIKAERTKRPLRACEDILSYTLLSAIMSSATRAPELQKEKLGVDNTPPTHMLDLSVRGREAGCLSQPRAWLRKASRL
jgi:hypothetical protein